MRLATILLTVVLLSAPVFAQDNSDTGAVLKQIVSGKLFPLTLVLKDLNPEWTTTRIASTPDAGGGGSDALLMLVSGAMGGSQHFYTKGDTVKITSETYLVAYRPAIRQLDMSALRGSEPPKPEPLTAETKLSLALLNVRLIGQLSEMAPFDLDAELTSTKVLEVKEAEADSMSNLKQVGLAMMQYVQDYDEVYPPMKSQEKVRKVLEPYVRNTSIFIHPGSKQPYQFNANLSGKNLAKIAEPAAMVAAFEPVPDGSGMRAICFADGHVKRIPEPEWIKLKAKQKIP